MQYHHKNKLKLILIVGYGNMGRRHASHINTVAPSIEIIFLSQKKIYDSNYVIYNDLSHAIAKKPDAAIISNAVISHCDIALSLIQAGVHVLIEKPLSNSYESAKKFYYETLKYPEIKVLIGYQLHFQPGFREVFKIVQKKHLGRILYSTSRVSHYLPLWRPSNYINSVSANRSLGGGVLLELSHEYDYLRTLFGIPQSIKCKQLQISDLHIDVEDIALSLFEYENGMIVKVHQDMVTEPPSRSLTIVGSKGTLFWDIRKDLVQIYRRDTKNYENIYTSQEDRKEIPYLNEINHFFDCILSDKKPLVTALDGCNTLKMIERARNSNRR